MTRGYQALREGAAWFDISERARIRVTGEDRIRLLHALATNVIEGLAPGESTETFFLNAQGRIQARVRVYVFDDFVLLETEGSRRRALLDFLDSYIIMDDVCVEDATASTAAVAVEGPGAKAVIDAAALGAARVLPSSLTGEGGAWIETSPAERQDLIAKLEAAGAVAADAGDVEAVRVENRIPRYGADYTESNIPHETQLLDIVSFTKGCYIGQEIVERVRSLGKVNRLLVPVEVEAGAIPGDLTARLGEKAVGALTSPVVSPSSGKVLGFAVLRREAVETGQLTVGGEPARALPWR